MSGLGTAVSYLSSQKYLTAYYRPQTALHWFGLSCVFAAYANESSCSSLDLQVSDAGLVKGTSAETGSLV